MLGTLNGALAARGIDLAPDAIRADVEGTNEVGSRMPEGGPFLSQSDIDVIRQWITDGAEATTPGDNVHGPASVSDGWPVDGSSLARAPHRLLVIFDREIDASLINTESVMLRRFDEQSFVVKLPEGHQIAVPVWMLDAVFCNQLPQRDHPTIALKALLELAELIQRQGLPCSASNSQSGPSPQRGGIDALSAEKIVSSAKAALCEKGAVGETSPTQSNSLSPVDR
jgi:hypothetical protein